jgi:hypothetical protein
MARGTGYPERRRQRCRTGRYEQRLTRRIAESVHRDAILDVQPLKMNVSGDGLPRTNRSHLRGEVTLGGGGPPGPSQRPQLGTVLAY